MNVLQVLLYFLLFSLLNGPLHAQSKWQLSAGAEYGQGIKTTSLPASPINLFITQANFERIIAFPNTSVSLVLNMGWQQTKAQGNIVYPGLETMHEQLLVDNFNLGGGMLITMWSSKKIRPIFGVNYRVGIPVRFNYSFTFEGFDPLGNLPLDFSTNQGGRRMITYTTHTGIEFDVIPRTQLRIVFGIGHYLQPTSFSFPTSVTPLVGALNRSSINSYFLFSGLVFVHQL